jgi:hypothetical protein
LQILHRNFAVWLAALKKRGGLDRGDLRVAVGPWLAIHQDFELRAVYTVPSQVKRL